MKFIISFFLTALLSFALGLYLDWWSIAIAAFIVAVVIPQKPVVAWVCGFLALFILWGSLAFWKSHVNGDLLAAKIANVLPMGGSVLILKIVTAFVGALIASFAALSGSFLRDKKAV